VIVKQKFNKRFRIYYCYEILSVLETESLLHVITDRKLLIQGQEVPGVGTFPYDDVLLTNNESNPILSLKISDEGARSVPVTYVLPFYNRPTLCYPLS
jgi:hypothetical protein